MLLSAMITAASLFLPFPSAAQRADRLVALAHLDAAERYFNPAVATNAAKWDSLFAANVITIADAPNGAEYGKRIAAMILALGDAPAQQGSPQRTLSYNGFPSATSAGSGGYGLEWKRASGPVNFRVEMGEGSHVDVRLSSDTPANASDTAQVSPVPTAKEWTAAYPAVGYRMLGAMRLWSTIRLFNPYMPLTGENWDAQLRTALAAAEQARDAADYGKAIDSFAAHIHDTHVLVRGADMRLVVPNVPVGAAARLIEKQLVITRIADTSAQNAGLKAGDVVVSVDNEPIDARITRLTPYLPASTPQALRYRLQSVLMSGSDATPAKLVVRGATGGDRTLTVPRSAAFPQRALAKHRTGSLIRMLPGNIGYIDLERLPIEMVDSAFRVLADAKAIILDDRGYPLGTAWSIAPRLNIHASAPVAAKFKRRIVSSPDTARTTWYEFDQPIPPSENVKRYAGKTVMLIDERTLSQAEHTGLFFEAANGTKFIGSPTMGSNGDVTTFTIPGGLTISFTGHDVRHADGRQLQRVGLQPELTVLPTIAGIRSGHDEVLEAAHRFLGGSGEIPRDTVNVPYVAAAPPPAAAEQMPSGWVRMGMPGYRVGIDRTVSRSGGASGHVLSAPGATEGFGSVAQIIRADDFRGKRIRFSAYVKTNDVSGGAVLWMRVDGNGGTLAFDNMNSRAMRGSAEWTRVAIVLDVPAEAEGIYFGMLVSMAGEAWVDDASFEVVGTDDASTNMLPPTADPSKAAAQRASVAKYPRAPVNLQFDP